MCDQQYVGDQLLLERLDTIRRNIVNGTYDDKIKQDIFDTTECYVTGKVKIDGTALRALMLGLMLMGHSEEPEGCEESSSSESEDDTPQTEATPQ